MLSRLPTVLFILILGCWSCLHAQNSSVEIYELLLSEVNLFEQHKTLSKDDLAFIDSAKVSANRGDHNLAIIWLETALDGIKNTDKPGSDHSSDSFKLLSLKKYELMIKTGVDFNHHEFEFGFIQSDSVLIDEVQKPFLGFDWRYFFKGDYINGLASQTDFRIDKENITGRLQLASYWNKRRYSGYGMLGMVYNKNNTYPDLGYNEANSRFFVNYRIHDQWSFILSNDFRYKRYENPSQGIPDFIRDVLRLMLNFNTGNSWNAQLLYVADLNSSQKYQNNDFFEQEGGISLGHRLASYMHNQLSFSHRNNNFTYVIQDSIIRNQSMTYLADYQALISPFKTWQWRLNYEGIYKLYANKSEQDADYFLQDFQSILRKAINAKISVEGGYRYTSKRHLDFAGSNSIYIREQNYFGHGLIAGADFSYRNRFFLAMNASYTWRRYPDNQRTNILSLYANRDILTLFMLGQIPLLDRLALNIFLTYDNDKDLDNDRNDTRSAIFSCEFQYTF